MTKENLNLPKTSFLMRANLPKKEPEIIQFWDKIDLYKQHRKKAKGKEARKQKAERRKSKATTTSTLYTSTSTTSPTPEQTS